MALIVVCVKARFPCCFFALNRKELPFGFCTGLVAFSRLFVVISL
jgi:hypothetical protein